ncbi:Wadjet anti-phage system protein JetD domain-containing protein [Caballeronia sp. LZ034LL]|uniref:Wadjet anti-phage system protein JetD domain-containing protein n=1 Tax=Caballeronia sp. LZ034LL TaxID=3038567 RepID=UPI00285EF797|nr:Wadjet anti-phage system protein JetD domain-containing protein [Caballeronia sp. LZ034LL]MDR5839198.1 DUF2220 family protein [Caballeronia sp. LZ034LL]
MPKKLLSPEAAQDFLVRRFNNQHQTWLSGGGSWPLIVSLGTPTEKDIAEDPTAVRSWASAWQGRTGPGEVAFEARQFVRLGKHMLPVTLSLADAQQVAAAVGQSRRWTTAAGRIRLMLDRWSSLAYGNALASRFDILADYTDEDFDRLMSFLAWVESNPQSNLYLRQIPVEGLDTKWLEKRMGLIAGLLRAIRGVSSEDIDFHTLCGLRKPAHRVRIRLLCPSLRAQVAGLCDIEAPAVELAGLPISPRTVFIVENLETGLAFPDIPDAVVVMRLGNAVGVLGALPWIQAAVVAYWGDIDTHGFAILDRARRVVPHLRSVLMDEATLLSHESLWGQELSQCPDVPLLTLTTDERRVYGHLRSNTWGQRVRLEQERLNWKEALAALGRVVDLGFGHAPTDESHGSTAVPR